MLNLHPLECTIKDNDHIPDLLLIKYWGIISCKYDVEFEYIDKILKNIRPNIANHNKWKDKPYRGKEGITLENIAKTPKYKKRLIIYDKAKELNSANNNEFLSACSNSEKIISYFKNKIRFELNINTMEQIRQLLNIPNNNLITVLNSCSNPILSVIDEALLYSDFQETPMTLKDYEHSLLLKECNYDMSVVEAKVRSLVSKNTYIKRVMQPYKELYTQMQASSCQRLNIRELVAWAYSSNKCIQINQQITKNTFIFCIQFILWFICIQ